MEEGSASAERTEASQASTKLATASGSSSMSSLRATVTPVTKRPACVPVDSSHSAVRSSTRTSSASLASDAVAKGSGTMATAEGSTFMRARASEGSEVYSSVTLSATPAFANRYSTV